MENASPQLTIALPVYNGEHCLGECLRTILGQTYSNFQLIIFDNASTDRTREIALDAARTDTRVIYHRNVENLGPAENFLIALTHAKTEYFAWRADDDLSSLNYFECLVSALQDHEDAALAVGGVEIRFVEDNRVKSARLVKNYSRPRIANVIRKMMHRHPSWIYGVWRTEKLRSYYLPMWERYPAMWAHDHLVLFGVFLDDAMTVDPGATFIQQVGLRSDSWALALSSSEYSEESAFRQFLLLKFHDTCMQEIRRRRWSFIERTLLKMFIPAYVKKCVGLSGRKRRRAVVRKFRQMFQRI